MFVHGLKTGVIQEAAERQRQKERGRGREKRKKKKKLLRRHSGGDDSYNRRSKERRKKRGDCGILVSEQLVFRGRAYLVFLFPPLCCHSLSSTEPAGEGASAVPGLVTCPSIPQELRQGHCDRNGDSENRTRQGHRGTVTYAE